MNPSYPIVFYVSGHGFGHTSRIVQVIHALVRRRPDATIIVKTSAPRRLYDRAVGRPFEFMEMACDTGMAQVDSVRIDVAESLRQAEDFQAKLPDLASAEASFLSERAARVVVGDIPPLAFQAAAEAGIPSIAIGNFTWDWIYEAYPAESLPPFVEDIRNTYRLARRALRLPMAGGFCGLEGVTRDIPFIARRSHREPDDVRRAVGLLPRHLDKPLVLASFGGYGIEGLDTGTIAGLSDYRIAITDSPRKGPRLQPDAGLLHLSERHLERAGLRYEDLVRAADVVVTKPGYGIISEAIANDTAILYTSRGHFVEYDVLVKEMPRYLRAEFIDQGNLLRGNWAPALEKLLNQPPPPEKPAMNGADVAATEILSLGSGL
jgi:L-arabinokinase